ncbi:MAG: hypothetical protein M0R39_17090 [Prolixibacteraceae bacterium]|nr:hypothetical protein [Prolixibacteraceae bacterium]
MKEPADELIIMIGELIAAVFAFIVLTAMFAAASCFDSCTDLPIKKPAIVSLVIVAVVLLLVYILQDYFYFKNVTKWFYKK